MSSDDSSRTHSLTLNVSISEHAATNIARATSTSDSSFQLYLDPLWSNEEYTREIPLGSWRTKRPSGSRGPLPAGPSSRQEEIDELLRKGKEVFSSVPEPLSPLKAAFIEIHSDSSNSTGGVLHNLEGGGDNEANSDDSDYEEPSFADGDLDEVSRVANFEDYDYVPEASPETYVPTPQPELEGIIYVGGPAPDQVEEGSNVKPGMPRVLACKDQSTTLTEEFLKRAVDKFRPEGKIILPTPAMRCYRFDHSENGGRVPRMVLTAPLMRIGVSSPLHPFIRDVCDTYHLAPIQINPNGYRAMIALYILYHKLGYPEMDARTMGYFLQLKRCGASDFGFVYFSVWPEFNKKDLIHGCPSNAGSWKGPYFYIYEVPRTKTSFNYLPGKQLFVLPFRFS